MTISATAVGTRMRPFTATVERERIAFFARTIGETDPVFTDVSAARAAGHPDLPLPPTFPFSLLLGGPAPLEWLRDLGIDLRHLLHGSQAFEYHGLAFAGEELGVSSEITDVYEKRGGSLQFVVRTSEVVGPRGPVVTVTETLVVRDPAKGQAA